VLYLIKNWQLRQFLIKDIGLFLLFGTNAEDNAQTARFLE
jgi:hypothetical protein